MKKVLACLLSLSVSLGSTSAFAAGDVRNDWLGLYVQNGATGGDGSINNPFGSIEEARDKIREIKNEGKYPADGITVYLREGDYMLTKSIEFTEEDSGTETAPVTYRAFGEEQVSIIGGWKANLSEAEVVTDDAVLSRLPDTAKNKVVQFNLKKYGFTEFKSLGLVSEYLWRCYRTPQNPQGKQYFYIDEATEYKLQFNDEFMTLARYPNEDEEYLKLASIIREGDYLHTYRNDQKDGLGEKWTPEEERKYGDDLIRPIFGLSEADTKRILSWGENPEIKMWSALSNDWSDEKVAVKITKDGGIESQVPWFYIPRLERGLYLYNVLDELDMPGEFYLDRETGMLYFYPPNTSGNVEMSFLEGPLVNFNKAENVKLSGVKLQTGSGDGIMLDNAKNIVIELCEITKMNKYGVNSNNASNCRVQSCHIHNVGSYGVLMHGGSYDDLTPGNNIVENCEIHNFGVLEKTYAPGIALQVVGNKALYNEVYDCPHVALNFNGNDHLFEYNNVYDAVKESDDMAACYAYLTKSTRGTAFRHNYIHDLTPIHEDPYCHAAFYMDGRRDGTEISSNIIENCGDRGIMINCGRDNIVTDNIIINVGDMGRGLGIILPWTGDIGKSLTDAEINSYALGEERVNNPAYWKYPHFKEIMTDDPKAQKYNVFQRNVSIDVTDPLYISNGTQTSTSDVMTKYNTIEEPLVTTLDSAGFASAEKRNYTLLYTSPIYEAYPDFVAPDFENIGLYTDWLEYKTRNTVSLMVGSPKAYTDFKPGLIDNNNPEVVPVIVENTTYVPFRYLAEAFDGTAEWSDETRTAELTFGEQKVVVNMNDKSIMVDGVLTDGKPIIENGRILVPLRVISESLGKNVEWFEEGIILVSEDDIQITKEDTNLIGELERRLTNK